LSKPVNWQTDRQTDRHTHRHRDTQTQVKNYTFLEYVNKLSLFETLCVIGCGAEFLLRFDCRMWHL